MTFSRATLETPLGPLLVVADDHALREIRFLDPEDPEPRAAGPDPGVPLSRALEQLAEFLAGRRRAFDLSLAPTGTPFQIQVWAAVAAVPFGRTASYGGIARAIGRPGAARAVGAANGANPLPIVVPCHRIVGADGSLTGYGGGLERKRWLLALEDRRSDGRPLRTVGGNPAGQGRARGGLMP